jgi:hypothetical protein
MFCLIGCQKVPIELESMLPRSRVPTTLNVTSSLFLEEKPT